MLNASKIRSNKDLAKNISSLSKMLVGKTALVLTSKLEDIDAGQFKITDFFDVVIAENEGAIDGLPYVDFLIYGSDSAYKDSVMHLEDIGSSIDVILCTNYNAISTLKKLKRRNPNKMS